MVLPKKEIPVLDDDTFENTLTRNHSNGHGGNNGNGGGNGNGNNGNGNGNGGNDNTWNVDLTLHNDPVAISNMPGISGSTLFVSFPDGAFQVMTSDGPLSAGPAFSVDVNPQGVPDQFQFWIKEARGKNFPLYTTGVYQITPTQVADGDFRVHLDGTFELWRLKKWNGGPAEEMVGLISFEDLHFIPQ